MAVNKLFIMLPVMFAARKLDGEDPQIVFLLRCLYGAVQTVSVLLVIAVYLKASAAAGRSENGRRVIYVPPPPQPFEDPTATKRYTEKNLSSHLLSTSRSLLTSTIFGICMTVGLHLWKGMIVGLAIQSIMAPFNLIENPLVHALILGGGLEGLEKRRIFGEKSREEMGEDDEVVDDEGNRVLLKDGKKKKAVEGEDKNEKSFEDLVLDTWDLGEEANISKFMSSITKENVNNVTKENGWAPIMILSGLGAPGVGDALKKMKGLGANPQIVDKEGWNALHWAAFHGSAEAATILLSKEHYNGISLGLHTVADKEGKTPIDLARDENNNDVVKVIQEADCSIDEKNDVGMRKRK